MKSIKTLPLLFIIISTLLCCSPAKEESKEVSSVSDTTQIINTFICGLWSMDSGNTLNNQGFYFRNDGTVDFVSSEFSGNWKLIGTDSLKIEYNIWTDNHQYTIKIDSLSESRMVLSDSDGQTVYRKVPFGMNNEGNVIQGFSGYISPGQSKEYKVDLPPAKKIMLKMACPDSSVTFRLFDDREHEITSTSVHSWAGILIRTGKYKILLSKPLKSKMNEEADFDLKVMVF